MLLCPTRPRGTKRPIGFSYNLSRYPKEEKLVPAACLLCSQDGLRH